MIEIKGKPFDFCPEDCGEMELKTDKFFFCATEAKRITKCIHEKACKNSYMRGVKTEQIKDIEQYQSFLNIYSKNKMVEKIPYNESRKNTDGLKPNQVIFDEMGEFTIDAKRQSLIKAAKELCGKKNQSENKHNHIAMSCLDCDVINILPNRNHDGYRCQNCGGRIIPKGPAIIVK